MHVGAARVVAVIFVVAATFAGGRYCWKTLTHRIAPRLATWLIFLVASGLSLWSYRVHDHAMAAIETNIENRVDVVELVAIVLAVIISARHDRERLRLSGFDWGCLVAAVAIVFIWGATGSSFWTNILLQALMCIGYGPTFWHLLRERRNTEPFDMWCVSLGIAALGLVPPLLVEPHDRLAIVYAGRAVVSVTLMLGLMWHCERQQKRVFVPR